MMTEASMKIKDQLSYLSITERAEIAYFLIHSLEEELEDDVESGWNIEISTRMNKIKSENIKGETAEEVFKSLRAKHS